MRMSATPPPHRQSLSLPGGTLEVDELDGFFKRLRGLLGRDALPAGHAVLLAPCSSVHCIGMRFAIDAVFIDRYGTVLRVLKLEPGAVAVCRGSAAVLELAAGEAARLGIAAGLNLGVELSRRPAMARSAD